MTEQVDIIERCAQDVYPHIAFKQAAVENEEQTLYVVCGTHLYALNAGTGVLRWGLSIRKMPRKYPPAPEGMVISLPASQDGLVGLATWRDRVLVTSHNSFCYALAAEDGALIWRSDIGYAASIPVIAGETMYLSNGTIYALNVHDGAERWIIRTQDVVSSPPVIVGDTLYTGSYDDKIYAIDKESGRPRWTYQTAGRVYVAPIVDQGTLYAGAGNEGRYLLALDAATGKLKWQLPTLLDVTGQLLVYDGLLYTCYRDQLVGLNVENGRPVWRYPGIRNASLLLDGHRLYVAAHSGDLYAFDTSRHQLLWRRKLRPLVVGSPCRMRLLGNELYVGLNEHGRGERYASVHAINTLTGDEDWSVRATWNVGTLDVY